MTAKEYLYQIWNLDREIEIEYRALEKVRSQIGVMPKPDPDTNVGRSGTTSDPVFAYVAKVQKLEAIINKKIDKQIDLRMKITMQIDGMENRTYRNILKCRYILMLPWDQVAESVGYERRQCLRLHGRALQEFERKYLRCH